MSIRIKILRGDKNGTIKWRINGNGSFMGR